MHIIPRFLDGYQLLDTTVFRATPIYFVMVIFINVHDYFIDNVIWRGNNEEIRTYRLKSWEVLFSFLYKKSSGLSTSYLGLLIRQIHELSHAENFQIPHWL